MTARMPQEPPPVLTYDAHRGTYDAPPTWTPPQGPSRSSSAYGARSPSEKSSPNSAPSPSPSAVDAPSSFSRPAPSTIAYAPFRITAHEGFSVNLGHGFPVLPPPDSPFADHDVVQNDWARFLTDIKRAGSLDGVPVHMRNGPVGELLDQWNRYFFHPRRMHVVLALGNTAYTGRDPVPADTVERQHLQQRQSQSSFGGRGQQSAYDDDSSDSDGGGRFGGGRPRLLGGIVGGILGGGRDRRDARRRRRRERGGLISGLVGLGASAITGAVQNATASRGGGVSASASGQAIPGTEDKWRIVISYRP
ncbi:hypothetical protein SCP_1100210 [Sparassis crispa]|uniref:Uncharacterized protein n=1 Tax=Sparassis crispa TaxID=139825 RepID=A0A401GYV0_9APHY|nr:hypothetical protein SCP_1100210 [Sparassis crispa]GBE87346.1 hypothetical protein SCP_1100210 [Sparassis crispa]